MKIKFYSTIVLLLAACCITMAQHKSKLKPGELSPDFKYEDSKGKVHSLSELRGKYVLIDFWASYCQPCKEELPCWKELIRKFKKEKIAFVTISIDYSREDWLEALKKEKLESLNLIIDNKDISFVIAYCVETIPRYVLLDKEGKIINLYMPRPSDPQMLKILQSLKCSS